MNCWLISAHDKKQVYVNALIMHLRLIWATTLQMFFSQWQIQGTILHGCSHMLLGTTNTSFIQYVQVKWNCKFQFGRSGSLPDQKVGYGPYNGVFSCDQAALQMVFSVCLSVRLSVCLSVRPSVTPFWLCSHHRIIMKFSGVVTSDRSDVHAKGQGQRSKVKVTEVTTQLQFEFTYDDEMMYIAW